MHCESQEADPSNGRAGDYHGAEDVLYAHGAIVECPAHHQRAPSGGTRLGLNEIGAGGLSWGLSLRLTRR